jgi:hypothetical protein
VIGNTGWEQASDSGNDTSGGTLLSELVKSKDTLGFDAKVFAAVRSQEQVDALSNLDAKALLIDVSDEQVTSQAVIENDS